MLKIDVIAVGKNKKGPWFDLQEDYASRLRWPTQILEVESKHTDAKTAQEHEQRLIAEKLDDNSYKIVLDERGKELRSVDFAAMLQKVRDSGHEKISFLIGGADGFIPSTRDKADYLLSLGNPTWPHIMARVMLLEQIYRAQQIIAGHPYHREG